MTRAGSTGKKKVASRAKQASGGIVRLTEAEKEIIVTACKAYRQKIPTYLISKQNELTLIDAVLEKLSP